MTLRIAIAIAVALAGFLAACASDEEAKKPPRDPGVRAQLQPTAGSAIHGLVTFLPYQGGVDAAVSVWAGNAGPMRIVIHSTGVCTSPNGFSAGPPWIPPGAKEPPTIWIANTNNEYGIASARLPGLKVDGPDGIRGKSVVVHLGTASSLDAQPDVPNNRVACGVIETNQPIGF